MVDIPFVGRGPDVVRAQVVMPVDGEGLPAFGAQAAPNRNTVSDDNLVQSAGTTNGTAGVWQEVLPANVNRQGATIANRNASGNVFIVRKEVSTIRQGNNESLYEYLEGFNALEQSCCNLGINEKMLVEYLLEGIKSLERMMLDAGAGGTVINLSLREVRHLIKEFAESASFRDDVGIEETHLKWILEIVRWRLN